MLALAVCLWGTHYKLSLYHPSAAHQGPAAKLLSQKERPVASVQIEGSLAVDAGSGQAFAPRFQRILSHALSALPSNTVQEMLQQLRILHGLQEDSYRLPFRSLRQSAPRAPPIAA